jgi:uncharacterized protein (UPF0210 family)
MQIRTVTSFVNPGFPLSSEVMREAADVLHGVRRALEDAGYVVQTTRLALPPFGRGLAHDRRGVIALARNLESSCRDLGIDYATIGPACAGDPDWCFDAIPDALAATERVFASALVTEADRGINLHALALTARVIHDCARITPDGFGNLRFAALANVPPGVPFLPAAYHDAGPPARAVGVEAASLAVEAVAEAASAADARARLVSAVEAHADRLVAIAEAHAGGAAVTGIDFSLAPFPDPARSLGTAVEQLAGAPLGAQTTLAAVAFLADTIDRARFRRAGYSGVFLPVFEDSVLAARAAEGRLTVNDLLLYSTVCGTGLDTVPLPGDISAEALAAVLLDVATLALRLAKPLTARLMPIPGKHAGDKVGFDFPYFAPTRVFAVDAPLASRLLVGRGLLEIAPRALRPEP